MNAIAFDPFLSAARAEELGVEPVDLDDLLARSDFITLHVPKNEKTAHMINRESLKKTKKGVRIVNCSRGGIINEPDLKEALESGHVAGAALDVFEVEPAETNVLFGHPNVICTPHLGASTTEAQVNVAVQVAEQMSDFLLTGAVSNAVNMPSISAEEAPKLRPYMALAEQLGSFAGQIADSAIEKVEIEYQGAAASLNAKPLTAVALAALLRHLFDNVNMVNAQQVAKARGIAVSETLTGECEEFHTAIRIGVVTAAGVRNVAGTLFAGKQPRIVNIEGVPVEAAATSHMLYTRNTDKPGFIGGLGTILGKASQNIADFRLGRIEGANTAVALVALDAPLPDAVLAEVEKLPNIVQAKRLRF